MTWHPWPGILAGLRFAPCARSAGRPARARRRAASLRGWEECEPRTLLSTLPSNAGADTDGDGISNAVEAAGPNGGDANRDGLADAGEANVASFPNAVDGRYISIVGPERTSFTGVRAEASPAAGAAAGLSTPYGLIGYTLHLARPGDSAEVMIVLPDAVRAEACVKFGPTPDNPTPHLYQFPYDGTTGAASGTGLMILRLVDGLRGDDDLTANGVIVDQAGPALFTRQSDLVVTASRPGGTAVAGSPLTYTLTVRNAGPWAATGVVITSALPAGATLDHVALGQGTLRVAGGVLTARVGNLDPGARATVTITVTPRSAGTLAVSGRAAGDQVDPDRGNNAAALAVRVEASESTGPKLVRVQRLGSGNGPLVLTFDRALKASTAVAAANYRLVDAGADGRLSTRDDRTMALRSVSYNAAAHTVTIVPAGPLNPRRAYRLTINGTTSRALTDISGHRLDGNADGRAGGDALAMIPSLKR